MTHDIYSKFECQNEEASYYFFHLPKTAGTSLNAALEAEFPPEAICPPHLWHELLAFEPERLSSFRLFRGHFYASLDRIVDGPLRAFVFLRNPIERALSHYGHVTRDGSHYLHDRAIELGSLENYLRDPVARETVRNFQAKCLVARFDPVEIAAKLSDAELAGFALEKAIETAPIELPDAELLKQAKEIIDKFCCIGITERFEDSVRLLNDAFGWNLPSSVKALNTNAERPKTSKLTATEVTLLEELNSVDNQLYEYSIRLFEERLTKIRAIQEAPNAFVSYAQNFEDVMLWRALKHVEQGFYIDVGANDPSIDSVTKAFYERGWHGINIEPLPSHHADLSKDRPRDINLQCAAGSTKGEIDVWECDVRGWATASADVVAQHSANGHKGRFHKVPVRRLTEICDEFVTGDIHFLKIDVEGFEESVIRGLDFSRFRPWILVVEATKPNSTEEVHDGWEGIVLGAEYSLAYCDGLNRFYVANEHSELLDSLRYPPNVFDSFIRWEQLSTELRAQKAEARATQAEARATQAEARATQAEARLSNLLISTSWRITMPLRACKRVVSGNLSPSDALRITLAKIPGVRKAYHLVKDPVGHGMRFVARRPRLKKSIRACVGHFPALERRLIERRAAQLRADFSSAWLKKAAVSDGTYGLQADFFLQAESKVGQHNVDEILERIRAELRQAKC